MEVVVVEHINPLLSTYGSKSEANHSGSVRLVEGPSQGWRKATSLAIGMVLMNCMGSLHAISSWNAQLKSALDLSQAQISFVTSCASFGFYLAVVPGVFADRMGTHKSVLCCGVSVSLLYLMMALSMDSLTASSTTDGKGNGNGAAAVILFGLGFVAIGQGACFGNYAALVSNEGLFGESHRGKILALLKSSFSAGGALYAFVYQKWFDQNVAGYFRFMGVLFASVCVLSWLGLFPVSNKEADGLLSTRRISQSTSTTSTASSSRSQSSSSQPEEEDRVEDRTPLLHGSRQPADQTVTIVVLQESLLPTLTTLQQAQVEVNQEGLNGTDITGRELLSDCRFWLLFVPVFVVVGAAVFVMSNVAFIVESRGGPMAQVPMMIAGLSLANTISRLVTGTCSDHLLVQVPRAYFAALACVLTAVAGTSFLMLPSSWLLASMVLAGTAEGVMFAIWPVIVREAFGLRHFGKNYGFVSLANVLGFPLVLSPFAALVYHWAAGSSDRVGNGTVDGVEKCFGAKCFQPVFVLVIVLCGIALRCSMSLARRYHYVALG